MRKLLFMTCLLNIVLIQSSLGFDDSRKGFIVGLGAGVQSSKATATSFKYINGSINEDSDGVVATSFKIGYGFNDNFLLHYTHDVSLFIFKSSSNIQLATVAAIAGTYYFNAQAPSIFITTGYGLGELRNISNSLKTPFKGSGWILGGGYEFSNHLNVELSIMNIDLSSDSKLSTEYTKYDILSTRLTINYLWY